MNYTDFYDWNFLNNFNDVQYRALENLYLDIDKNFEINVIAIINAFGIKWREIPMQNISGRTSNGIIEINANEQNERKKFSMAHELGHIILESNDKTFYRFMDSKNYEKLENRIMERKANNFAADLLMPPKLVGYAIKFINKENKSFKDDELVTQIKNLMHLSYTFVGYRLKNLGFIGEFNAI